MLIDVGFSADQIVKELYQSKTINDKSLLGFKMDCKAFLVALAKTMTNKSPLTYAFVQHISCIDPREQVANPSKCNEDFRIILTCCVQAQKVKECDCEIPLFLRRSSTPPRWEAGGGGHLPPFIRVMKNAQVLRG